MNSCPKCGRPSTIRLLTKQAAERIAAAIADDLYRLAKAAIRAAFVDDVELRRESLNRARQQILLQRPNLYCRCSGCEHEFFVTQEEKRA